MKWLFCGQHYPRLAIGKRFLNIMVVSIETLRHFVLLISFWKIIISGEVSTCSSNATVYENTGIERCPEESSLALILFAIYMIFTNVLLLSLLIAMFR